MPYEIVEIQCAFAHLVRGRINIKKFITSGACRFLDLRGNSLQLTFLPEKSSRGSCIDLGPWTFFWSWQYSLA